jgi:hypothetical protein
MMKKKFIHRQLVRSPKAAVVVALLSGRSSSSSSSLSTSPAVEKAPLIGTSMPVPTLRKEDGIAAAIAANLVPVSLVDATSAGVDLIVLSSDSEDEVDCEALAAKDEVG